jgi:hypothetical protein
MALVLPLAAPVFANAPEFTDSYHSQFLNIEGSQLHVVMYGDLKLSIAFKKCM